MSKFAGKERLSRRFSGMARAARAAVKLELEVGGQLIADDAARTIIEQTPSGKFVRSRGDPTKLHEVSPPGSPPNADTSELHSSLTQAVVRNDRSGIEVQSGQPVKNSKKPTDNGRYARALELGTPTIAPRPFLSPAFKRNVDRIEKRVRAAAARAIRAAARGV